MLDAVEHICLDRGVMVHVEQAEPVARFERFGKTPVAHEVAAKTGVASEAIGYPLAAFVGEGLGADWFVGHFEAVGHVAGERGVDDCGVNAGVGDDIENLGHEVAGLPGECAPGLDYQLQARIFFV